VTEEPASTASRKRKSTSIVDDEVAGVARKENRAATKAEIEAEIQKKRREGNAAAAKKCRENQKAKYEKLAREKAELSRQLQAVEAINVKLTMQVQRLQYENMMMKKQRFSEFTRDSLTMAVPEMQSVPPAA